ncbi:ABC transporter ATP-binding protein [Tissierella carlieri]|uniref:ABC transporter ATP-binding protein n=1 Tax=Tissierella carlieri TaxID=689904 RepID=A0ABT1SBV4_9FIRM|nr:ABC transporter ATP-binding protein [Tissierella carlieri]MBU5313220.1 ABC transporter ATP-binding protein [Tissierella carlieri]MCQ4923924.1 ABC transporter ATP-binding protein [Tissierella carlieri]MDU5082565.1 ABC transporter ATP-binding protein [Bacillota bacterium]
MPEGLNILTIKGVSISFGGLKALSGVDIEVIKNSVHGIIGPNGAGKSTLFNVITGIIKPDSGDISLEEKKLSISKSYQLVPAGISRTFQNIRLFKEMSVLDNVMIGHHVHTPMPILSILLNGKKSRKYEEITREKALEALEFMGLEDKKDEIVKNLSYGQQRLVEFARALAAQPKIILLDEPAAGMNPTEKINLLNIIDRLRKKGYTLILIEHDMKLVMNICDRISVLNHGKIITQGIPEEVRNNPDVISAYLGKGGDVNARDKGN